jgi:hypothetical protein
MDHNIFFIIIPLRTINLPAYPCRKCMAGRMAVSIVTACASPGIVYLGGESIRQAGLSSHLLGVL